MVHEQTVKNNNIQALQTTVVHLEADTVHLQADMFDDIDGAGMDAEPDAHLHSDPVSEFVMIKKQIQELIHRLLTIPPHQPGPSSSPTPHDATVVFLPVVKSLVDEFKQLRNNEDVKLKSFKDVTEDVPLNFILQDWERTFHKLNREPKVADVLDKIQPVGNLWSWYQSQCTHQDSRGSIPAHDIINNWTWERFKQVL
jgi:hypothetical protein